MKRILSLALCCALLLTSLPGCATSSAKELSAPKITANPAGREEVNAALAEFGLSLLQRARTAGEEPQGTLLSPLSVALALSMTANGADGTTLAQFLEVLGGGLPQEELNGACVQLMQDYQNLGGSTRCSIANSLWTDPDWSIQEDFIGTCRGVFDAQVFQAELSSQGVVRDLNAWVSQHTNKMIPQIVNQPFDESTAALMVNALYLKNKWAHPFSPNSTGAREFTREDGSKVKLDFLNAGSYTFPYLQGEGAQGVVLPYDDGRLAFFALLPDLYPDAPAFEEWLSSLEGQALSRLLSNRQEDTLFLHLGLPKFTAEWRGELTGILPELGLEEAFQPGDADFSRLGDAPEGYYISQVIHAAKIEVNEKGTEAAAATVVAASGGGAPADGITLVFDRPFLYGIVDLYTGVPLFLGTYE
ncbi:MAG: serine protease [Lawsonibacter sp.]|nr:serine protease [Lawsonibacter sp.]